MNRSDEIENMQQMLNELNLLHEISQKISERKELHILLNEIIESSKEVMKAEAASLLLYDEEKNNLYFESVSGDKKVKLKRMTVKMGKGIAGWVAENKKSLLIEDCYKDDRFNPAFDIKTNFKTRSMICVPMLREGTLVGIMQVINKKNGLHFNRVDQNIYETLAAQCAIAIENTKLIDKQIQAEAVERELETARKIQRKLLPNVLPAYDDLDIAAFILPAKVVSGDYYNIHKLNDHQSLFVIADVSGKSISAALIVSIIDSCLDTQMKCSDTIDLQKTVEILNRVLIDSTTLDKFATCWFGLYDHKSKKLISINAGHNAPLLFRKNLNDPIKLIKGGIILGSMELPFVSEEVELQRGDTLVIYTDGITEAWNKKEEEYEEERLVNSIRSAKNGSAKETLNIIIEDVTKHVDHAEQSDDLTCYVIKVK